MDTPIPLPNTEVKHLNGDGTRWRRLESEQVARHFNLLKNKVVDKKALLRWSVVRLSHYFQFTVHNCLGPA